MLILRFCGHAVYSVIFRFCGHAVYLLILIPHKILADAPLPPVRAEAGAAGAGAPTVLATVLALTALQPVLAPPARTAHALRRFYPPFEKRFKGPRAVGASRLGLGHMRCRSRAEVVFS